MIMVQAGPPVDDMIAELVPLLTPGDILIDGGNTHYPDTTRRTAMLEERGSSSSGRGSPAARRAPSGPVDHARRQPDAWPQVKPIFQAIAAKVDDGTPCCDWVGPEGPATTSRWSTTGSSTATCS